jgi:hypothetical protein
MYQLAVGVADADVRGERSAGLAAETVGTGQVIHVVVGHENEGYPGFELTRGVDDAIHVDRIVGTRIDRH